MLACNPNKHRLLAAVLFFGTHFPAGRGFQEPASVTIRVEHEQEPAGKVLVGVATKVGYDDTFPFLANNKSGTNINLSKSGGGKWYLSIQDTCQIRQPGFLLPPAFALATERIVQPPIIKVRAWRPYEPQAGHQCPDDSPKKASQKTGNSNKDDDSSEEPQREGDAQRAATACAIAAGGNWGFQVVDSASLAVEGALVTSYKTGGREIIETVATDRRGCALFQNSKSDAQEILFAARKESYQTAFTSGLPTDGRILLNSSNCVDPTRNGTKFWSFQVTDQATGTPLGGASVTLYAKDSRTGQVEPQSTALSAAERGSPNDGCVWLSRTGDQPPELIVIRKGEFLPAVLSASAESLWTGGRLSLRKLDPQPVEIAATTAEVAHRFQFPDALVQTLPLSGIRTFDALALLAPGVLPAPQSMGTSGLGISPGTGTAGQFAINGMRGRDNAFSVDGSDNSDETVGARRQGYVFLVPHAVESIQDFYVITSLADARFGRTTGGQINATSREGSSGLHSEFYGFLADRRLQNRSPFDAGARPDNTRDPFTRVQSGGYVSAPLDKLLPPIIVKQLRPVLPQLPYIFVAGELRVINTSVTSHFATPTTTERAIDAALLGPGPFYRTSIPGAAIFSLYPFPNNPNGPYGPNTYSAALTADGKSHTRSVRASQPLQLSGRTHSLYYTYAVSDERSVLPSVGNALASSIRPNVSSKSHSFIHNTNIRQNISNTVRYSFGKTVAHFNGRADSPLLLDAPLLLDRGIGSQANYLLASSSEGQALLGSAGLRGVTRTSNITGPLGQVALAGYSPVGVDVFHFPQHRRHRTQQAADTILLTKGRNAFAFGGDSHYTLLKSFLERNARPFADFRGLRDVTGSRIFHPATMAAMGVPAGMFQTLTLSGMSQPEELAPPSSALFPNSDPESELAIKRIQVDLFAHWEHTTKSGNLTWVAGFRLAIHGLPQPDNELARKIFEEGQFVPRDFRGTFGHDRVGNDPRLGFAWNPQRTHNLTLRAGWGVYTAAFPAIVFDEARSIYPTFLPVNVASVPKDGRFLANLGIPGLVVPGPSSSSSTLLNRLASFDPILAVTQPGAPLKNAYSMQHALTAEWNFSHGVLGSASYAGTVGRKLLRTLTPDGGTGRNGFRLDSFSSVGTFPGAQGQLTNFAARNPEGILLARTQMESNSNSSYHSLQIELRKRGGKYQFGSSFTYGHSIDTASDFFDLAGSYSLAQNSIHSSERASSAFDARLRSVSHFLLDLPKSRFGGDWQVAGIYTLQSGQPYTINSVIDSNRDGNLTDRPNLTPSGLMTLNPNGDGNLGRNTSLSQGIHNLDLAFIRTQRFHERIRLVFRAEAFNSFNRWHMAVPSRLFDGAGFATAARLASPPRTLQFALKIGF